MENASKALMIAGGVLIGVLILTLMVYLFTSFGSTAAEINAKNAEQQITEFNTKFTSYEGKQGITIYDIITIAGYAKENNDYYQNYDEYDNNYRIQIHIKGVANGVNVENKNEEGKRKLINSDFNLITNDTPSLPTYACEITQYHNNNRVSVIEFSRIK